MSARVFRRSISIALRSISAIFLLIGAAFAAEPVTADPVDFQITGQPLDSALNEFARQSDREIFYASDVVDGVYANGVDGKYEPEDALELLLADSGLEYSVTASDTFLVSDHGGDSDSKNSSPAPILMAQNTSSQAQTTVSSRSEQGGTSVVTGRVTDARTGTNLRGAKVAIEETGQWTSTGDLGRFRFASVPEGEYTLTVSFLGYAEQSAIILVQDGLQIAESFALRGGSDIEEIVVFGARSARAIALNQERTADNFTTVVSSDLLGRFEGATLAEALNRAPGIAFQEDPLTGNGTNVIVRGLAPDLNQIRLDGQRLAEGSGVGRSPSIGNLLTDTIDEVVISKTLLPSQDSSGTGGLIEISTLSPLDRNPRHLSLSAQMEKNDFQDIEQYSGLASVTFGEEKPFGVSLGLNHRELQNTIIGYNKSNLFTGQYLPLAEDGSPILSTFSLDPRLGFPFDPGVDSVYSGVVANRLDAVESEISAVTAAGHWEPFEGTSWRLNYTGSQLKTTPITRTSSIGQLSRWVPMAVDELGGEIRATLTWEDAFPFPGFPTYGLQATTQQFSFKEEEEWSDVLSFQGETASGSWIAKYRLSTSTAETDYRSQQAVFVLLTDSQFFDVPSEFIDQSQAEINSNGSIRSLFPALDRQTYQLPIFNEAGFAFYNSPENFGLRPSDSISETVGRGKNERKSAAVSLLREFEAPTVDYVEIGVEYEESRFDDLILSETRYFPQTDALSLSALGIDSFSSSNLAEIGVDTGLTAASAQDVRSLFARLASMSSGGNQLLRREVFDLSESSLQDPSEFTDESELAAYLQAKLSFGDFEFIGGVRYSYVDVTSRILQQNIVVRADGTLDPGFLNDRRVVDVAASESSLLPRMILNYRPTEDFIVRAGYFESVARPRIEDLSNRQQLQLDLQPLYGPTGDRPQLAVSAGNPDLEPSRTRNFDLSVEFYDENAGAIKASLFFKDIENLVELTSDVADGSLDGIVLPDDTLFQDLPDDIFVLNVRPANNDKSAEVWGVELAFERRFVNLPGIFGGLGVFANYTYSESEKFFVFEDVFDPISDEFVDIEVDDVPFDQSPKHSGTVAVTYNMHNVDASIAYTAQSERLSSYRGNNLSRYLDSDDSLDIRFEYQLDRLGANWRIFLSGSDLLKGSDDPDTLSFTGEPDRKYYTDGTFFGGRTIGIGVNAVFQ